MRSITSTILKEASYITGTEVPFSLSFLWINSTSIRVLRTTGLPCMTAGLISLRSNMPLLA
jgi:hypothetical protein